MVEHLLVIDIIACNFLPIAQYKALHVNLRWLGVRVQSRQILYTYLVLHFLNAGMSNCPASNQAVRIEQKC